MYDVGPFLQNAMQVLGPLYYKRLLQCIFKVNCYNVCLRNIVLQNTCCTVCFGRLFNIALRNIVAINV